jgi:hypothetical protein
MKSVKRVIYEGQIGMNAKVPGKNWRIGKLARAWEKARCEYGGCRVVVLVIQSYVEESYWR